MSNMNNMNNIMMKLFMVILLMMFSMGVNAKVDVELNKEYKGGKVKVKSQEDQPDGSTLVTITVAPDQGFTITHSDKDKGVIVYAVRPTSGQSGTRAPEISSELEVTGPTGTVSYPNSVDYQFTVPAGLNAWVQDIKFQKKENGAKATTIDFNQPNGYYYLGNQAGDNGVVAYKPNSFGENFYMCPAYSTTVNANNYLNGDSNKPLITTFKSFTDNSKNQGKTYLYAIWYVEAQIENNEKTGYFYIKHNESGQYLVANDNTTPTATRRRLNLAPIDSENPTAKPGNDGLFKIQSDDDGVTFYITPKEKHFVNSDGDNKYLSPAKGNKDFLYATGDANNTGGTMGLWAGNNNNSAWHFVKAQCDEPAIAYNNTTGEVTITSTEGATIYYTTDGATTPDPANAGEEYPTKEYDPTDKPTISNPTTFKAIALKTNMVNSEVATQSIEKLVSPNVSFDYATQKVIITTNSVVEGVTNVYTIDDSNPTPTSEEYSESEAISLTGTTTVKAMTVKDGYINSDVVFLTVTQLASTPSISISGSTVTLSCSDPAATIHYTTDGSTPTQESASYSTALTLDGNQKYTIKAIAAKTGFLNSDVVEDVVDNRSSIDAPTITYTDNIVTITASDYGDVIYYTTDGTPPTTSSTTHFTTSGTFNIVYGGNYIIRAIASNGNVISTEATVTIDLTDVGYAGIYYLQNNADGAYYMYPVGGESALVKTAKKTDEDAIWKIEIVGDYYRIIHYKDGKYLVAKDLVEGSMPDTETVYLVETNSPGDNALFEITRKSGDESDIMQQIILIRPKAATNVTNEDGHIYLNTRGGNNGTNIIGLYDNTGSSEWKLVTVPAKPTFTVNDIKVTISSDLGSVYYTIDGTTPTSSSTPGKNVTLEYGPSYTVKAICIYHDAISNSDWTSEVATSSSIQVNLLNPIFTRSGNNVTITNSQASGVTFRYTFSDNGTDPAAPVPSGAGTDYEQALPLTANARNVFKAIAYNTVDGTTYKSDVVTFVVDLRNATTISSLADITSATGSYKLASGFTATGTPQEGGVEIGTSSNPFKGTIDGNLVEFELSSPLFDYVEDATIKNVIISKATINTSGNAGAIANNALGATRIYNCGVLATGSTVETDDDGYTHITSCSSTISSSTTSGASGYVGGIVGLLDGSSRVINCFSYANITGGNLVGGIVGKNAVATTSSNLKTMVMNCMFYGDITGGNDKAPIYNGTNIINKDATGVGNYNYFLADATFTGGINTYNCALMAEKRFLQRFEFFRQLLNSHRELAGWWATGTYSKTEMAKWVMEPSQLGTSTPYPILKAQERYPSVVNIDVNHSETYKGRDLTVGPKLSTTLSVTIQMGSGGAVYAPPTGASITTSSLTLNITDKDPDHFNFNYYKVQLPYYNDVGTKNYNGNRVVTGWKIVSITNGTAGSYTAGDDASASVNAETGEVTLTTPYNFADRHCTNKDLYSSSGRVFNQGAYWDVPEGVTAITIEPYWAKCVYLADEYADVVYNTNMSTAYNVPNVGGGKKYTNRNSYSIAGESQKVFTSKGDAIATSNSGLFQGVSGAGSHTVYDYAVVLVGNYHFYGSLDADASKPYTVTSIDLDGDNEPDYSYILRFDVRKGVHPVRVDFLNVPGLGMAQKSIGGTGSYNFGIMQPKDWFEVTNTALFRVTQLEYEQTDRAAKPLILHGGVIEQWVSGQSGGNGNLTTYIYVGSNVWFKEFHLGCHQDSKLVTKHPPVSVTGGDYNEFYLTGLYSAADNYDDNAECYINGGRFDKVAGTGIEGIGNASTHANGNIVWQIQNADINEFYGGGINAAKPIEGSITTVITDSHVKRFCGGPKFGDMNTGKTVITTATNCTFGSFFGAGYGGNSYYRGAPGNFTNKTNYEWNKWIAGTVKGNVTPPGSTQGNYPNGDIYSGYDQTYNSHFDGVSTRFDYQFLPQSDNVNNVGRLFIDFVKFSLATTHNVTSTLTGCTITGNFYGGGSLGKVDGNVTSTLTNCTVRGSVFGGGYDASRPTVQVMSTAGFTTPPNYNTNTGVFFPAAEPYNTSTEYTWEHSETVNSTETAIDKTNHILYTTANLTTLGQVTGNVTLDITGNTLVEGLAVDYEGNPTGGDRGGVFGGGDASAVLGNTTVTINATALQTGAAYNAYRVYGGGNSAPVGGNSTVILQGNTQVFDDVFGGGNEGEVGGSATVTIRETPTNNNSSGSGSGEGSGEGSGGN